MSQGQMVAGVGGVLLIVGLFLDWVSGLGNAFDAFSGIDIILLIIGIVAIAWAASAAMGTATPPALSGMLVGLLGVVALGWSLGWDLEEDAAGIGAWLSLVASIAIAWGGLGGGTRRVAAPAARRGPATPASPSPPPSDPAV
jgi:hypothetical protein